MYKTLNDIEKDIVEKGIISDDDINAFKEIDGMMSNTTMAWAINTCHKAVLRLGENKTLIYKGKELTIEELKNILSENLSDFMVKRIFEEIND